MINYYRFHFFTKPQIDGKALRLLSRASWVLNICWTILTNRHTFRCFIHWGFKEQTKPNTGNVISLTYKSPSQIQENIFIIGAFDSSFLVTVVFLYVGNSPFVFASSILGYSYWAEPEVWNRMYIFLISKRRSLFICFLSYCTFLTLSLVVHSVSHPHPPHCSPFLSYAPFISLSPGHPL